MNSFIDLAAENIQKHNTAIDEKLGAMAALLREVEELRAKNWEEMESIRELIAE